MHLFLTIFTTLFILKNTNADLQICDNNECQTATVISSNLLFSQLQTIMEGNENTTKYLHNLNERFENKINSISNDIGNIKESLKKQTSNILKLSKEKNALKAEIDYSIYDHLWIVIQRRQDGSVDFYRNWTEYKNGFGNQIGEFFVGLDKIHDLTNDRPHELLITLEDFEGNMKYAHYDEFLIDDESERYQLKKLGSYSGNAGNNLRQHQNMFFSTKDRDNDMADEGSCAEWFKGAWWYFHCLTSNLNGPYRQTSQLNSTERGVGVTWGSYDEILNSYKSAQMMIRSK